MSLEVYLVLVRCGQTPRCVAATTIVPTDIAAPILGIVETDQSIVETVLITQTAQLWNQR